MRKTKILLTLVMVLALALSLAVMVSAATVADVESEATCDHDYILKEYTQKAPCGGTGYAQYVCFACGETKEEEVGPHTFTYFVEYVEGEEPTCTETGMAIYECLWCSERETRKVLPAHDYVVIASTNATCTENGSQSWECTICGDAYDEVVESRGHNWKWSPDSDTATCTEDGIATYSCWNCSETKEETSYATGHNWSVDESTFDAEAHTISKVCSNCDQKETVSSIGTALDPAEFVIGTDFTASVTGDWTFYKFAHTEGYLTFTFDTDNVNAYVQVVGTYDKQYFWGGETTWTAEILEENEYIFAICSNDGSAIDIKVSTAMEETYVAGPGETVDKAIEIEYINTAYEITNGKMFYKFYLNELGTIVINVEGNAKVYYSFDPEAEFTASEDAQTNVAIESYDYQYLYIAVETAETATLVLDFVGEPGTASNPYVWTEGTNNIQLPMWGEVIYKVDVNVTGNLTVTFGAENIRGYCGANPMQIRIPVVSGEAISVMPGTYYFALSSSDHTAVQTTATVAIEEESQEVNPEGTALVMGENQFTIQIINNFQNDIKAYFTATEAGKYVLSAAEGEETAVVGIEDAYGFEMLDLPYSFELEAGETIAFVVSTSANVMTTTEDVVDLVLVKDLGDDHVCDFSEIVSVEYADGYLYEGVKVAKCSCGAKEETVAEALVEFYGWSAKENGTAMCAEYVFNFEAIAEYEAANETTFTVGVVAAATDNLVNADSKPINADGTVAAVTAGKIYNSVVSREYANVSVKIVAGDWTAYADKDTILCAYVIDGDVVSYICDEVQSEEAASITYNAIV
jgi:hypothetical protein